MTTLPITSARLTVSGAAAAARHRWRAGLRQTMRAEWTKLVSLRSTRWTLLVTAVGTLLVTFLSTHGALHHSRQWYRGFDPTNQSLAGLAIGSLALGVLGVLAISGEYGTGHDPFVAGRHAAPRRAADGQGGRRRPGARSSSARRSASSPSSRVRPCSRAAHPTASLGQPGVLRAVALSGAFLALFALLGLGIGTVIRHTAGAIAVFAGVHVAGAHPAQLHLGEHRPFRPRAHLRQLRGGRRAGKRTLSRSQSGSCSCSPTAPPRWAWARSLLQPEGRVTPDRAEDSGVRVRIRGRELSLAMTEEQAVRMQGSWRGTVLHEPFTKRVWSELAFFLLGSALAGAGLALRRVHHGAPVSSWPSPSSAWPSWRCRCGAPAASAGSQRSLARSMLGETVEDPQAFAGRPGLPGLAAVVPARPCGLACRGLPRPEGALVRSSVSSVAFSLWWDAFACLLHPLFGRNGGGPAGVGSRRGLLPGGRLRIRPDRLPPRTWPSSSSAPSSSSRRPGSCAASSTSIAC